MKHCLPLWLLVLLLLHGPGAARATAGPPATGRPLAEALNPDGTLRTGAAGSFDARAFRMGTAPDGRPVFRPAGALGAGDERWQDGFGLPNGADGTVHAVVVSGANTYIGGSFTAVGNVLANRVAKWNGTVWSPLGTGVGSTVSESVAALAVAGNGEVYVGGRFATAGGITASNVAKWNGTTWSSLGTGAANGVNNGGVAALAIVSNGDVYAGGGFTLAGGVAASNIAKWNGTVWSPLGSGTEAYSSILTLAVASNGDLYAAGRFAQAGGVSVNNIARWNGSAWSSLGTGAANGVTGNLIYVLAVAGNGDVYAGGDFSQAGGAAANGIAKWNGTAWTPLGAGMGYSAVRALAVAGNGEVYAGGFFTQAGGVLANNIAKWNGTSWSSLGTGAANGVSNDFVYALAVAGNGDVYAGGGFTQAGGPSANRIARWNGTAWNSLGTGAGNGLNDDVYTLAVAGNGDVYAGGRFTQAGGVAANYIAKWNGTAWSALGTGTSNGMNNVVFALAIAGNGEVYAGGRFTQAGGVSANNIARWNGTSWSALGSGAANGVSGDIFALAVAGTGDVYVGGYFTQAGGAAASEVAKWNGTTWSPLGAGLSGGTYYKVVRALAVAGNGDVYAGGDFTRAGGAAASFVAKWNGTAWSPLGSGITGGGMYDEVSTLVVAGNGDVYAGGGFSQAGGTAANGLAKWNGATWASLGTGAGNGVNGQVRKLTVAPNGDLYVGGNFTLAGVTRANGIGKWNGTTWSALGTGVHGSANSVVASATGNVYAGGIFTTTGDGSKVMAHFALYDPAAPLATAAARATPAAQLFPNPAHGTATLRLPATAARQPLTLTLTDALGRLVRQYPAPAGPDAVLDLRGLPAGVYLVRCGELSQRLVVE